MKTTKIKFQIWLGFGCEDEGFTSFRVSVVIFSRSMKFPVLGFSDWIHYGFSVEQRTTAGLKIRQTDLVWDLITKIRVRDRVLVYRILKDLVEYSKDLQNPRFEIWLRNERVSESGQDFKEIVERTRRGLGDTTNKILRDTELKLEKVWILVGIQTVEEKKRNLGYHDGGTDGMRNNPSHGEQGLSYKGAVESQARNPNMESRQGNHHQQAPNGRDLKGKGVARENPGPYRHNGPSNFHGGRNYRHQGEGSSRNVRQSGQAGEFLERREHGSEAEDGMEVVESAAGASAEMVELNKTEGRMEKMKVGDQQPLNSEDLMEEANGMDEDDLIEETNLMHNGKENPAPKRRTIKPGSLTLVGNTKKRFVQSVISPRKKIMSKQAAKAGEKGSFIPKKANPLAKTDHE
ncbi:unnamed protein product [Eruca vesicaria subsp. sativa]|uniref:Uncharacterized protein n=1 Tax=Eruca vesicaria subsp. sativa TaxID=29727 RepID=A0ABC8KHP0_ERUVS|nr:unnamed protein product [Eruca vesicaria subsp. sativa]